MATYVELHDLQSDNELQRRVTAACVVAAETVRSELGSVDNHANRLIWAANVFTNPASEAKRMLWALLAANKDSDASVITGAADSVIQAAVDTAIDLFATGG